MSECMDNYVVHLVGRERETLEIGLKLMAREHTKVTGWRAEGGWIVFGWSIHEDFTSLPTPMATEGLTDMVCQWLTANPPDGKYPDTDGSVTKGFEPASRCSGAWGDAFRVRAIWAIHGK